MPRQHCENCEAAVTGRFCPACGQRVDENVHSLWEFLVEALEDLTNADSRLWQTLWRLLLRPGRLTREFFAGRRVRYLPPVRLYLVLSLAFFVVSSLRGGESSFGFDGDNDPQQALAEFEQELNGIQDPERRARVQGQVERLRRQIASANAARPADESGETASPPASDSDESPGEVCEGLHISLFGLEFEKKLRASCETTVADTGRSLSEAFRNNLPSAVFLFLPVLAAIVKLLYVFTGRYYVEHLLLLIYNHSAAFLILLLYQLLALVTPAGLHGLFIAFIVFYLPWYTYRSLRVVYAQGRVLTLLKFFALGFSYLVVGSLMLVLTAVFSALTL
jgi:Protein of unknown function (DUF3667)